MSKKPKFQFGNVVVVNGDQIGLIVKTWYLPRDKQRYGVYVRSRNAISEFDEDQINHFVYVYSGELEPHEFRKEFY